MNKLHDLLDKYGVLVAAHRGMSCGNIPCNTIAAFEIAMRAGARILEMDIFKSLDGVLYVFHTGKEPVQLGIDGDVTKMTSEEIDKLPLLNCDGIPTSHRINRFSDVLEYLRGKDVLLNLDRAGDILPEVLSFVRERGMMDQILLKTKARIDYLEMVEKYAPDVMFMPIYDHVDEMTSVIESMNINFVGAELVFKDEKQQVIQPEYISAMKEKGMILWGNGILYSDLVPLSAGHSDDEALYGNPDQGWGWLAEHGFQIIQTDWASQCFQYLKAKGWSK